MYYYTCAIYLSYRFIDFIVKKVIYIEDNAVNSLVFKQMLKGHYESTVFPHGEAYFEEASDFIPDLFVLDINLGPDHMEGTEILKVLREKEPTKDLPIIAFTAYAYNRDQEEFYLDHGFDAVLSKPGNQQLMLETIGKFIR